MLDSAPSEFAPDLPVPVLSALRQNALWVEQAGPDVLGPLGVLSGVIFAVVTRASWGERSKGLDSATWDRVARCFSGRRPTAPLVRVPVELGLSNLEEIATRRIGIFPPNRTGSIVRGQ